MNKITKDMQQKKRNSGDVTEVVYRFQSISSDKFVYSFAAFMVNEFVGEGEKESDFSLRQKIAWKNFQKREKEVQGKGKSGKCLNVSDKTKKRWFGLDGDAKPKRHQIFQLAFELGFSPQQTEQYLMQGLGQPGIQYNDYREWLYLYGLQNELPYRDILDMTTCFLKRMQNGQVMEQKTHTEWLKERYRETCGLSPDDFLRWMCDNAGVFKGYSRAALHYFEFYKDEVIRILRSEEQRVLKSLLDETDFENWKREQQKDPSAEEPKEDTDKEQLALIRKYVRHASRRKSALGADFCQNILISARLVYGKESRHFMLMNLFPDSWERKDGISSVIGRITDKEISKLLHIADYKEKEIRALSAEAKAESEVQKQREEKYFKSGFLIERGHLLPLIHYVSQVGFWHDQEMGGVYDQKKAIGYFKENANRVLQACGMEPISEQFALDYLLLSCFGTKDMFQISEVAEILEEHIP